MIPTPNELREYTEAILAGVPMEVAAEEVWGPDRRPTVIYSVVDGNLLYGWDTCGTCMLHIKRCRCPNGPVAPERVERWRNEALQERGTDLAVAQG